MSWLYLLFVTFFMGIVNASNTIQTSTGWIHGKSVRSGRVSAFLGIPFAEPPIGPLRFKPAVPKTPWTGVYEATRLPPPCIQVSFPIPDTTNMTEDCLFLNLWVPRNRRACDLPILIFIYGGALMFGTTDMEVYDGATLADYGNVIVATMNYRLGALGFFYGSDDDAAGNMGMYDQLEAIRWIKENAPSFGGDPDNIALMGQSAGAFCVTAHLISPLSKNLFKRAILMSGSLLHPRYFHNNYHLSKLSQTYADLTGCSNNSVTLENDPEEVIRCMRGLPAKKFSEVDRIVYVENSDPFILRTGDIFLQSNNITDELRKCYFNESKEILLGLTANEGALLLVGSFPTIFGDYGELATSIPFNETSAKKILRNFMDTGSESDDNEIIQIYLDRVNIEEGYTYLRALSDAAGDVILSCGLLFEADFHSQRNERVYFYRFDYRSPSTPFADWMLVTHFEDFPYFFGNPMRGNFTNFEKRLSRYVMNRLATFIRTGNPNTGRGLRWPQYSYDDQKHLTIGENQRVGWSPDLNRCESLRRIFDSVMDGDCK